MIVKPRTAPSENVRHGSALFAFLWTQHPYYLKPSNKRAGCLEEMLDGESHTEDRA